MNKKNIIIQVLQFLALFIILCFINTVMGTRINNPASVNRSSNRTVASIQRPTTLSNRTTEPTTPVEQTSQTHTQQKISEQPLPKEKNLINSSNPFNSENYSEGQRKEFLKHFYAGRTSYRNDDYGTALKEFNIAKEIYPNDTYTYYYLAMIHRDMDRYQEGIAEAKKGLMYQESDSFYAKNQGFTIDNSVHYYEYKVLGDCYRYDGRYEEAKKAYSIVIDNNQVKYRDTYLRRGKCHYYLNDMESARKDFENHRLVINKYLANQADKHHSLRDKKQKYDKTDLVELDEWINKTYK